MSNLKAWFCIELEAIGKSDFSDIFDFVEQLDEDQARENLRNLLGAEREATELIERYLRRRGAGPSTGNSSSAESSLEQFCSTGKSQQSRRERRGRGKAQKSTAATGIDAPRPAPAKAIQKQVSVDDVRQKVREYMRSGKAVNCMFCGKIEMRIPQDGNCSFCNKPIFSVHEDIGYVEVGNWRSDAAGSCSRNSNRSMNGLEESESTYGQRCLRNKYLPGGGPKFQSEFAEQLDGVFS